MKFGIFLSAEEHGPLELVRQAQAAERAGFTDLVISDHFHPWLEEQGEAPFVWSVIGGIAATTRLRVTTFVTCPTTRIHPAIVAQAAATSAVMLEGRFRLGVGTGEALNEHILGDTWPPVTVRLEMLEEAVEVIRELWNGRLSSIEGAYYTVHNARLYTCPDTPPPVLMSAYGPKATEVAARIADGFITTHPDAENAARYTAAGGRGPKVGGMKVCFAASEAEGRALVHRVWRVNGLPGQLSQELPLPSHFTQASELVSEEVAAQGIPCGHEPAAYLAAFEAYRDAGFDELHISQVGPDLDGFLRFFADELRPRLEG